MGLFDFLKKKQDKKNEDQATWTDVAEKAYEDREEAKTDNDSDDSDD